MPTLRKKRWILNRLMIKILGESYFKIKTIIRHGVYIYQENL